MWSLLHLSTIPILIVVAAFVTTFLTCLPRYIPPWQLCAQVVSPTTITWKRDTIIIILIEQAKHLKACSMQVPLAWGTAVWDFSQGQWKPSLNIGAVLGSIRVLMAEPNHDDGLMGDIVSFSIPVSYAPSYDSHQWPSMITYVFCDHVLVVWVSANPFMVTVRIMFEH
jgi:hypothetical protein